MLSKILLLLSATCAVSLSTDTAVPSPAPAVDPSLLQQQEKEAEKQKEGQKIFGFFKSKTEELPSAGGEIEPVDPDFPMDGVFTRVQRRREKMIKHLEDTQEAADYMLKKLQHEVEEVPACKRGWYFSEWRRAIRSVKGKIKKYDAAAKDCSKDLMKIKEYKGGEESAANLNALEKADKKAGKEEMDMDEIDYRRWEAAHALKGLIEKCVASTSK
uniref:RxLR effector protein n=1 Tax=Chromera velia CCMP2878 TaxID=1169474 RepID=A0A0G4F5F8_9ALVE|eukprot:Cvel_15089.t1-p1 / transcript=Cvel_15089.t1 / gene=Cvel_15089 / organism=Chromera_velia_CCMP2878 / gene_product=hypothetical protein / transcript_product=hypothetical protein / location=Cvel_scaffold1101:3379-4020(+) / protein_length=214 / sequence_SO=supercontig / SO=protein_coding / is_pseudo=false